MRRAIKAGLTMLIAGQIIVLAAVFYYMSLGGYVILAHPLHEPSQWTELNRWPIVLMIVTLAATIEMIWYTPKVKKCPDRQRKK